MLNILLKIIPLLKKLYEIVEILLPPVSFLVKLFRKLKFDAVISLFQNLMLAFFITVPIAIFQTWIFIEYRNPVYTFFRDWHKNESTAIFHWHIVIRQIIDDIPILWQVKVINSVFIGISTYILIFTVLAIRNYRIKQLEKYRHAFLASVPEYESESIDRILQTSIDQNRDIIIVINSELKIIKINRAFKQFCIREHLSLTILEKSILKCGLRFQDINRIIDSFGNQKVYKGRDFVSIGSKEYVFL